MWQFCYWLPLKTSVQLQPTLIMPWYNGISLSLLPTLSSRMAVGRYEDHLGWCQLKLCGQELSVIARILVGGRALSGIALEFALATMDFCQFLIKECINDTNMNAGTGWPSIVTGHRGQSHLRLNSAFGAKQQQPPLSYSQSELDAGCLDWNTIGGIRIL